MDETIKNLGPLGPLAGIWEGDKGADVAPSDDRGTENNQYRERITFVPIDPVDNHEQKLFGLRYTTTAWRLGEDKAFHEESGYWLWDPAAQEVMRCFLIPRGITVLAGGKVDARDRAFRLEAVCGSTTYGICSNPFLDREFKTVRYTLNVTIHDDGTFSYDEDSQLQMPGRKDVFHHTDRNRLRRISL